MEAKPGYKVQSDFLAKHPDADEIVMDSATGIHSVIYNCPKLSDTEYADMLDLLHAPQDVIDAWSDRLVKAASTVSH